VTGLRARGGVQVDIHWKQGKLARARLGVATARPVKVRYAGRETVIQAAAGKTYELGGDLEPSR
jgi:alpha-L-fucosidase 2